MVTVFGIVALSFMMAMYALERRARAFVFAFSIGCALSSAYGFISGAWPFGVVEAIWMLIALRRYFTAGSKSSAPPNVLRDPPGFRAAG